MCLNVGRTRRRLRKTLADSWRHLAQHAAKADASPELQHYLAAAGWHWRQDDPEGYSLQARTPTHPSLQCDLLSSERGRCLVDACSKGCFLLIFAPQWNSLGG